MKVRLESALTRHCPLTLAAIFNKILAVNKTMISSGRKDAALNPADETVLKDLRDALESQKGIPDRSLNIIVRIVTQWPYSDRLAGLDLLRCMARYPVVAQFKSPEIGSLIGLAIQSSLPAGEVPSENAVMMGVRIFANIFATADGRSLASSEADSIVSVLERVAGLRGEGSIGKFNRNMLIAVCTVALNYSVLVSREKLLTPPLRSRLLDVVGATMNGQSDSEVLYRAIIASGTILEASPEVGAGKDVAGWVKQVADVASELRVREVARECLSLISR